MTISGLRKLALNAFSGPLSMLLTMKRVQMETFDMEHFDNPCQQSRYVYKTSGTLYFIGSDLFHPFPSQNTGK